MIDQVRKDIENRLETSYHIRVSVENLNEHQRLCVIASLMHAYDTSWQVESYPSLIGANNFSNIKEGTSEANNAPVLNHSKKDYAALKRWLILMGNGHLIANGIKLADSKKFSHVCTTLMDKVEQRHGAKLKPMIRQIVGKQSRLNVKTVRNNQQLQLDNSSASNITMDSSENPFQGRAIARSEKDIKESDTKENTSQDLNSTFEKPKTPEKNMIPSKDLIPRTPLKEDVEKSGDDVKDEEKKSELGHSDSLIPNGKTIPRTPAFVLSPALQRSKKVQKINEKCSVDEEKQIINVDDIVIKGPNLVENQPAKEKPKENFIPSGKQTLPRTPFVGSKDKNDITDDIENNAESVEEKKQIKNVDDIVIKGSKHVDEKKNSESSGHSDRIIPNGKTIPRTPAIQQSNKVQEIQEEIANDKEKQIINVDDIVIKGPKLVEEDQPTIEKPKENFIPSGKNTLPRTPFVGSNNKNDITDEFENHAESIDNDEDKNAKITSKSESKIDFGIEETQTLKHFEKPKPPVNRSTPKVSKKTSIVCGNDKNDITDEIENPVKSVDDTEEKNAKNTRKPAPKIDDKSNRTRSTRSKSNAVSTKQEKKKSVDVLESPSKKIRKDKNQEGIEKAEKLQKVKSKIDLSLQPEPEVVKTKQLEKAPEKNEQSIRKKRSPRLNNDVKEDKQVEVKKVEKLPVKPKKNLSLQPVPEADKTQEQLEKTCEIEKPIRKRRSPRLNNDVVVDDKQHSNCNKADETVGLNDNNTKSLKPCAPQGQQRIERIRRNKSILAEVEEATASEAVKLPQIETKKRRGGGRKTMNAWPETNNVTIEEFVPTLKMVRDKNGKAPSKKIVDEVFSTPPVLAEAGKKQSKTKKTTKTRSKGARIFSIEDELYQTPARKSKK